MPLMLIKPKSAHWFVCLLNYYARTMITLEHIVNTLFTNEKFATSVTEKFYEWLKMAK